MLKCNHHQHHPGSHAMHIPSVTSSLSDTKEGVVVKTIFMQLYTHLRLKPVNIL